MKPYKGGLNGAQPRKPFRDRDTENTEILTGFHAEAQRARRDFDRINRIGIR